MRKYGTICTAIDPQVVLCLLEYVVIHLFEFHFCEPIALEKIMVIRNPQLVNIIGLSQSTKTE